MAESTAFEAACTSLEENGALDRLAARGTIRLALKEAGLEPKTVTAKELRVVATRLLPRELKSRGVPEPEALAALIARALEGIDEGSRSDTPDAVFARLGGS